MFTFYQYAVLRCIVMTFKHFKKEMIVNIILRMPLRCWNFFAEIFCRWGSGKGVQMTTVTVAETAHTTLNSKHQGAICT